MTASPDTSFSQSLARIAKVDDYFSRKLGIEDDQLRLPGSEFVREGSHWPSELVARQGRFWGTEHYRVAASQLFYSYAWTIAPVVTAAYVLERRALNASAANTVVGFRPNGWAATFDLIQWQPSATSPPGNREEPVTARVDADADAQKLLKDLLDEHMSPVIDRVRAGGKPSLRLQWGNVAAGIAYAFQRLHPRVADTQALMDDAETLLERIHSPLNGHVELFTVSHRETTGLFCRRSTCCLLYLASGGKDYCLSCPLHSKSERNRRMVEFLTPPTEQTG